MFVTKGLLLFGLEAGLALSAASCLICGPLALVVAPIVSFGVFSFLIKAYARSAEYKYGRIAARGLHGLMKSLVCAVTIFLMTPALFFLVALALGALGVRG